MSNAYQIFCGKCGKLIEEGDGTDHPPFRYDCGCEMIEEKVTRMIRKIDDVLVELKQ